MRIVIIGATGHVGSYLVPRLVRAGHEVVAISRGQREPYHPDEAWNQVRTMQLDRAAEEAAGTFGETIAGLNADAVVDMVCFTRASAEYLVQALRGSASLLVSCGSIWSRGTLTEVPAREDEGGEPWGEYGVGKAQIEELLLAESRRPGGLPSVVLHPGHISGPGWPVINPAGNLDPSVWERLSSGEELVLPGLGLETLHHVHADDVAYAFQLALENPEAAAGESFYVVSERAVTLRGFAEAVAGWFGRPANLRFVPTDEFASSTTQEFADTSLAHVERSHSMSIEKARRLLGYSPRYTSLEAVREAVAWQERNGHLRLAAGTTLG
jgi:nucleoside-diphosphate-sugar epimerase